MDPDWLKLAGWTLISISFSTATRYNAAAQLYLGVEMVREAVEAFIAGEEWSKAKKVARELEPRLEAFVDEQYKQSLRTKGNAKDLEDVDLISALDMYVEQGNWSKAIATASGHGPEVLHKYVAMHATQLIREGNPQSALQLYTKHGAPPYQANFNIYKRIGVDLFSAKQLDTGEAYSTWAELRDLYLGLLESLAERSSNRNCKLNIYIGQTFLLPRSPDSQQEFSTLLLIAHHYAARTATAPHQQLAEISTKILVSLLRHTDLIPADKVGVALQWFLLLSELPRRSTRQALLVRLLDGKIWPLSS